MTEQILEIPFGLDGLQSFLQRRGHTLLIKGLAGTGKTTLALQLLSGLGKGEGVYISSRVSEAKLAKQIPWIKRERAVRDSEFVDVRVDSPAAVLESIMLLVYQKKAPVIVLDTWDGLAKEMEPVERLRAEKTLTALADSSETRIIFVSEEPGMTTMDYMVDGIVELTRSEEHSRVFREIELKKLRGTSITQQRYLYTLLGGKFRHFMPYTEPDYSRMKKTKPIPDYEEGYSYGSRELDEILTPLRQGTSLTIEYGERVPYSAIRLIEYPLVTNFLNLGRSVVMIPLLGASVRELHNHISRCVDRDAIRNRLRIAVASEYGTNGGSEFYNMGRSKVSREHKSYAEEVERLKKKSKDRHLLVIDSISFLENRFATELEELVESLSHRVIQTQSNGDAVVFLLNSFSKLRDRILTMTDRHIKLFVKDRSIVLMGEKPATEAYVLQPSNSNPLLPEVTRVV
ncbi:MAG: gas vesicle protein GvpD P-loop domain-containing protein [Conexivisphaerales archaeon]